MRTNLLVQQRSSWGAEGTGMRRLTRELCDDLVAIPLAAQSAVLNVSAVAAGVCLFEVAPPAASARQGLAMFQRLLPVIGVTLVIFVLSASAFF